VLVAYSNQDVLLAFERFELLPAPLSELESAQVAVYASAGSEIWIYVFPDQASAVDASISASQWAVAPNAAVRFERIDVENVAVLLNPDKRVVVEDCLEALRG
jgi:hypothetical protein